MSRDEILKELPAGSISPEDAAKKLDGAGNGAFMKLALGACATVKEFEELLVREKGKWDLATNFGVIDAEGGACFFETRRDSFVKFDARDPRVAPFGTIVRTNFAFTSPDQMLGGGFDRFERIGHIIEAARPQGRIDAPASCERWPPMCRGRCSSRISPGAARGGVEGDSHRRDRVTPESGSRGS